MKHENYVSSMVSCLQVLRIYCTRFVYRLSLENNNSIKEIKNVVRASIACWKTRQSLWEFSSRWKPRLRLGFSLICSRILPNVLLWFSPRLWRHGKHVLFLNWNMQFKNILNYKISKQKTKKTQRITCIAFQLQKCVLEQYITDLGSKILQSQHFTFETFWL